MSDGGARPGKAEHRMVPAARTTTTASACCRIESGRHATNARTLEKLADAFGVRAALGFESGGAARPGRELVVLWTNRSPVAGL